MPNVFKLGLKKEVNWIYDVNMQHVRLSYENY